MSLATLIRVNSSSINASSAAASQYSVALGVAVNPGDVIIICAAGNGTHASNGMSAQDSRNAVNFTTILETDQGGASSHWMQTFIYQTPQALLSTDTIRFTPYALSTLNSFSADVFRGATAVTDQAAAGSSNAAATTSAAPALGANAAAGALVLTFCAASSGTLTPGSPFTAGSSATVDQSTAIAFVAGASGAATYASTWSLGTSNTSAAQTASFRGAPAPPGVFAAQAVNRSATY